MELCRVGVAAFASSEICPLAQRVVHYSWQARIGFGYVGTITGEVIQTLCLRFSRLRLVILEGSSPCRVLSGAKPARKRLHNVQSLFPAHPSFA